MDLLLPLLKNEYNEYKAELECFADYGANIIDNYGYYLKNSQILNDDLADSLFQKEVKKIMSDLNEITTIFNYY